MKFANILLTIILKNRTNCLFIFEYSYRKKADYLFYELFDYNYTLLVYNYSVCMKYFSLYNDTIIFRRTYRFLMNILLF